MPLVPASFDQRTTVVTVGPGSPLADMWGVARVAFERGTDFWDFLLVRTGERTITALSAVCRHQGCLVVMVTAGPVFVCPCHGSRYDHSGAVVRGPATDPLPTYPARFVDGVLTITYQT